MTAGVREPRPAAIRASWTAVLGVIVRRSVIPAIAIGAFLAFIGAFGSSDMPIVIRMPFMMAISFVGGLMGQLAYEAVERVPWIAAAWWRVGLISALVMFAPMGAFVWTAVSLMQAPERRFLVSYIPGTLGVSLVTSLFFCMAAAWTHYLVTRRDTEGAADAKPVKFLDRLPLKLRGAEIWAVEAEDHYLRLHTSRGQDLILMRLADAVAELEGIEGMQVHRSWWIARDAIADARRGDGRAVLTLKDGSNVPVSRTYAGELRDKGWI